MSPAVPAALDIAAALLAVLATRGLRAGSIAVRPDAGTVVLTGPPPAPVHPFEEAVLAAVGPDGATPAAIHEALGHEAEGLRRRPLALGLDRTPEAAAVWLPRIFLALAVAGLGWHFVATMGNFSIPVGVMILRFFSIAGAFGVLFLDIAEPDFFSVRILGDPQPVARETRFFQGLRAKLAAADADPLLGIAVEGLPGEPALAELRRLLHPPQPPPPVASGDRARETEQEGTWGLGGISGSADSGGGDSGGGGWEGGGGD